MLFMVIVPIITQILALDEPEQQGSSKKPSHLLTWLDLGEAGPFLNETSLPSGPGSGESEDISIGLLFASKAIVQLLGNAQLTF